MVTYLSKLVKLRETRQWIGFLLGVNQALFQFFVETNGQWTSPVTMVSPWDCAEVFDSLTNLTNCDVGLRVKADCILKA